MFGSTDTSTKHFRYLNASLSMGEISLPCLKLSWCWSLVSDGGLGRCRSILKWGLTQTKAPPGAGKSQSVRRTLPSVQLQQSLLEGFKVASR